MELKEAIKHSLGAIGRLRLATILNLPFVKRQLVRTPDESGWHRVHPFDRFYGTDTSGYVGVEQLPEGTSGACHAMAYAGSQPSVVRAALRCLPAAKDYSFIDLGCGKGRALLVASELPFKALMGVELNSGLARIAERNATIIKQPEQGQTLVRIIVGDASAFPLPPGNLVLFMYHPFDAELIAKVVANIEAALTAERREIFVIYGNPVHAACLDGSPLLFRRACMIPYSRDEIGFGPDDSDAVAIWEGGPNAVPATTPQANIVVAEGYKRAWIIDSEWQMSAFGGQSIFARASARARA